MISSTINLSTGPVNVSPEVREALAAPSLSHRSAAFKKLYEATTETLSTQFKVQQTFITTGSGTLANEIMLYQIKALDATGLILANGEFGSRLILQAKRCSLKFIAKEMPWGETFDGPEVRGIVERNNIKWLLFCHCETSIGVINNLNELVEIAASLNCLCFVDCMSTVGTVPMDLSKVALATASSGKGLASVPGLSIVFSNHAITPLKEGPHYFDLQHYLDKGGIPFTLSSNLVQALHTAILQKNSQAQFQLGRVYSERFFTILNDHKLTPFSNVHTKVFTIVPPASRVEPFVRRLQRHHIIVSHESDYLKKRKWLQLAILGYYTKQQLDYAASVLCTGLV